MGKINEQFYGEVTNQFKIAILNDKISPKSQNLTNQQAQLTKKQKFVLLKKIVSRKKSIFSIKITVIYI